MMCQDVNVEGLEAYFVLLFSEFAVETFSGSTS